MRVLGCVPLAGCTAPSSQIWPCSFKQLWFNDLPFLIPTESEGSSVTVALRSGIFMYRFMKRHLLDMMLTRIHIVLSLRLHGINVDVLRSIYRSHFSLAISIKTKTNQKLRSPPQRKQAPRTTLASLPLELRSQIFDHVSSDASVKAIGYRSGSQDAFMFKERGPCPLMLTCKQFYQEMLNIYFDNLSVTIKSASPSRFSGDMSTFGAASFRDRIRNLKITDNDTSRMLRISSAFQNAHIEHEQKNACGSRKGAYYF